MQSWNGNCKNARRGNYYVPKTERGINGIGVMDMKKDIFLKGKGNLQNS